MAQTRLDAKTVIRQWKKLAKESNSPQRKMTDRTLGLWAQKGLIPSAQGGGGQGVRKTFHSETVPEIFAGVGVLDDLRFTLAETRIVRDLALLVSEIPNMTPANSASQIERLSDAFAGKGRHVYGVIVWLRLKQLAMQHLYDHVLSEREKFFETKAFEDFLHWTALGYYRGGRVDENHRLVFPEGQTKPPENLISEFVTAGVEPAAESLSAKPHE